MISTQIRKANILLKKKDYQLSVKEYQIAQRMKTNQEHFLNTIVLSLLGYNHFCLMQYEEAQKWYSKALIANPFDSTTLSRRATLYLRIKQYKKAATDIIRLSEIQPQSIRISALMMELRQKSYQSWKEQSEKDPFKKQQQVIIEDDDEQQALNFSNVKKIDRVSIKFSKASSKRTSQINFGNDERIQYQQFQSSVDGSNNIQQATKQKLQLQQLQLNSVRSNDSNQLKILPSKDPRKPKKSILKTCSIAYRLQNPSSLLSATKTAPPMDVLKIKDIDGKAIQSSKQIRFSVVRNSQLLKPNPKAKPRKSCMKNISMVVNLNSAMIPKQNKNQMQRFSFGQLKNLQGKMLKKPSFKQKQNNNSSGDQSDEYNIFGDKDPSQFNQQLQRIQSYVTPQQTPSTFGKPKKSILKPKNQSMIKQKSVVYQTKKSVLFK